MFGSIGMPELVIILVIALVIFGPRKLPELGRSLGKSLGEFKRASNELRNTLEEEVRVEEQQRPEHQAAGRAGFGGRGQRPADHSRILRRAGVDRVRGTDGQPHQHRHHRVGLLMALVPFPKKSTSSAPDDDPDWEDEELESESEKGKMSFLDHLDELRRRIIYSVIAIVIGFLICLPLPRRVNSSTFIVDPMKGRASGTGQTAHFHRANGSAHAPSEDGGPRRAADRLARSS